jgi:hypothetical protein
VRKRIQTYRPDNYDCNGAEFARPGVQFARFPQPKNFHIANRKVVRLARVCRMGACSTQPQTVWQPTQPSNPLAPYFPPFTHFVLLLRENHTFDDYLGDCATTIQAGCLGKVESTNHISQLPDLHGLAKQYALRRQVDERTADVGDVDHADKAVVTDDRQVPEMAAGHKGGSVADAGRRRDDGGAAGHQITEPDVVDVFPVRDRVSDVCLRDNADRLLGMGVQDHQGARARVLHQVSGRGRVVVQFCRRQRWPHDVRHGGCGRW